MFVGPCYALSMMKTAKPATAAQKNMIRNLRDKKATAENVIITDEAIEALAMGDIDYWKNTIWNMPWPTKTGSAVAVIEAKQAAKFDLYEDIANSNYAYEYNGKTHFYRVTREQGTGKWAGNTFIKVQERASDDLYKIYNREMKKAILEKIREIGPEQCRINFAERLGCCARCGKTLTDEFNPYKSIGLGPDCGTKI